MFLTCRAAGRAWSARARGVLLAFGGHATREAIVVDMEHQSMLGRAATLEDVGKVAAFVGSDRASTMTAARPTSAAAP